MKTRQELVDFCQSKIGTPYVYGAKGKVLTAEMLDILSRQNPGKYTLEYKNLAAAYIGEVCVDCSGLISWCTGKLRGSQEYYDSAVERRNIEELDETMVGWALWKKGHIGVYVGGGRCIEAKGIHYGTVNSSVSSTKWKKVLKLRDIIYEEAAPVPEGWQEENGRWKYYQNGVCIANDWLQSPTNGLWYWFDGAGFAIANDWLLYKDKWYYMKDDCSMVTGFYKVKNKQYYFNENGAMEASGIKATAMKLLKK